MNQSHPSEAATELTLTSTVELRPGLEVAIEPRGNTVALVTSYNEMEGPKRIRAALEFVVSRKIFQVQELQGLPDPNSKLVLLRRLIREGFVRQVQGRPLTSKVEPPKKQKKGILVTAGSGIKSISQITLETLGWLQRADKIMYCTSDPVTALWFRKNYPESQDLSQIYSHHTSRFDVYNAQVEEMMVSVREGNIVCCVYYGHPGLFVMPTHLAVEQAKKEGFEAMMLPGVSAADCLYADLGFDPSVAGAQYYEATDLLIHRRPIHLENNLIIWQIGVVGDTTSFGSADKLSLLVEYLLESYPADCEVFHYQGSVFPVSKSMVESIPLNELGKGARVTSMSTLYIPAQRKPEVDMEMAERLGMLKPAQPEPAAEPTQDPSPEAEKPTSYGDHHQVPLESPLGNFIIDCADNPNLLMKLDNGFDVAVSSAGLSENERLALATRMPGRIWAALEAPSEN